MNIDSLIFLSGDQSFFAAEAELVRKFSPSVAVFRLTKEAREQNNRCLPQGKLICCRFTDGLWSEALKYTLVYQCNLDPNIIDEIRDMTGIDFARSRD